MLSLETDVAIIERYRQKRLNGAWDSLPNDGYIYENLARHLIGAGLQSELYALLTESPQWMLKKLRLFGSYRSFHADLHLAIEQYKDPLSPDEFLEVLNLHLIRLTFPVSQRSLQSELLHLGFVDDAIAICMALPSDSWQAQARLSALLQIDSQLRAKHGKDYPYPNLIKAIDALQFELHALPLPKEIEFLLSIAKIWLAIEHEDFPKILNKLENAIQLVPIRENRSNHDVALINLYLDAGKFEEAEAYVDRQQGQHHNLQLQSLLIPELVYRQRADEALNIVMQESEARSRDNAYAEYIFALWKNQQESHCLGLLTTMGEKADGILVRMLLFESENKRFERAENLIQHFSSKAKQEIWRDHVAAARERAGRNSREQDISGFLSKFAYQLKRAGQYALADKIAAYFENTQSISEWLRHKAYDFPDLSREEREALLDEAFAMRLQVQDKHFADWLAAHCSENIEKDYLDKALSQFEMIKAYLPPSAYPIFAKSLQKKGDSRVKDYLEEGKQKLLAQEKANFQVERFINALLDMDYHDEALELLPLLDKTEPHIQILGYCSLLRYYLKKADARRAESTYLFLEDLIQYLPHMVANLAQAIVEAKDYEKALAISTSRLHVYKQILILQDIWKQQYRDEDSQASATLSQLLEQIEAISSKKVKFDLYAALLERVVEVKASDCLSAIQAQVVASIEISHEFSSFDIDNAALIFFRLGLFAEGLALLQANSGQFIRWLSYYGLPTAWKYYEQDSARLAMESLLIISAILGRVQSNWREVHESLSRNHEPK